MSRNVLSAMALLVSLVSVAPAGEGGIRAPTEGLVIAVGEGFGESGQVIPVPLHAFGTASNESLAGLDFTIRWDPAFATLAALLPGSATSGWTIAQNPLSGSVRVSMASAVPLDLPGDGLEIMVLEFLIHGTSGFSIVRLSDSLAFDITRGGIAHQTVDGRLEVGPVSVAPIGLSKLKAFYR